MLSSALKTHLHHTSRKIVNDSHTFLLGDLPDLLCDCSHVFLYICHVIEIAVLLSVGKTLRDGFEDRDSEFVKFEQKLEVC